MQIDRLGDNRQDVRQAACNLLLELLQVRVLESATKGAQRPCRRCCYWGVQQEQHAPHDLVEVLLLPAATVNPHRSHTHPPSVCRCCVLTS